MCFYFIKNVSKCSCWYCCRHLAISVQISNPKELAVNCPFKKNVSNFRKAFSRPHLAEYVAHLSCHLRGALCEQTSSCSWTLTDGILLIVLMRQRGTAQAWTKDAERSLQPAEVKMISQDLRQTPRGCGSSWRSSCYLSSYSGCQWN